MPEKKKEFRVDGPMQQSAPLPVKSQVIFSAVGLAIVLVVGGYFVLTSLSYSDDPMVVALLDESSLPRADLSARSATCRIGHVLSIPEQTFLMGSYRPTAPDHWPVHDVSLKRFYMDSHEVTNGQFARFVEETDYITGAETRDWSFVFDPKANDWSRTAGADWSHPFGPHSTIEGRDKQPVVHVSWHDATAYAHWADGRLPTEAEWECAARAGLRDNRYPWGNESMPQSRYPANARQIADSSGGDGYREVAPVGSFPASRYGLFDILGNVSEWCADWYDAEYYARSDRKSPTGPVRGRLRVVRGGSWLSPGINCNEITVFNRDKIQPDLSYQTIGFRLVYDRRP